MVLNYRALFVWPHVYIFVRIRIFINILRLPRHICMLLWCTVGYSLLKMVFMAFAVHLDGYAKELLNNNFLNLKHNLK